MDTLVVSEEGTGINVRGANLSVLEKWLDQRESEHGPLRVEQAAIEGTDFVCRVVAQPE